MVKKVKENGQGKPQVRIGKLSDFRPQVLNANQHTERGLRMLDDSMSEDGYVAPMTAVADGEVIDGSARLERAFDRFSDEAIILEHDGSRPIITKRIDIPDADNPIAKRIALRANRIAEADLSWNPEVLAELAELDPNTVKGMFSDKELAEILSQTAAEPKDAEPQIDKAEELRQKWGTETGQLWVIGNHRLLVGDATNKADVGRLCGNEHADVVYADPPYGYDKDIQNDETVEQALRVYSGALQHAQVAADAWAIVDTPKKYLSRFIKATEDAGWFTREPVLHMYRNSMANGPYGTNVFELSMVYSQGKPKVNHRHLNAVDVARKGGSDNEHPTQKFAESYAHFIKLFASPSALIYDPFFGSGTAFIACENTGRTCYGIELEAKFCAVTLERMTTAFPHLKIEKVDQARAA